MRKRKGGKFFGNQYVDGPESRLNRDRENEMVLALLDCRPAIRAKSSQPVAKPKREPHLRTKLARQFGVPMHKVQQALNVLEADPELLKQVANGQLTLRQAQEQVTGAELSKRANRMKLSLSWLESITARTR